MDANLWRDIEAIKDKLLPCPFCGRLPTIEPWHGGGPRKVMIQCSAEYEDECPANVSVTQETPEGALAGWNHRI